MIMNGWFMIISDFNKFFFYNIILFELIFGIVLKWLLYVIFFVSIIFVFLVIEFIKKSFICRLIM